MASLLNQPIDQTYQGLIKTTDNAAIDGTLKSLEDGTGNTLPVQVSTTGMSYSGTQDFSGATVIGAGSTIDYLDSWVTRGGYLSTEDIVFFQSSVYPIWLEQGMTLETFSSYVGPTGGPAGVTMQFHLFSSQRWDLASASGMVVPFENLVQLGAGIPYDTPGEVEITLATPFVVPKTGIHFIHYRASATGFYVGRAQQPIGDGNNGYQQINAHNIFNANASVSIRGWINEASVPASYPANTVWNGAAPNPFVYFKYS